MDATPDADDGPGSAGAARLHTVGQTLQSETSTATSTASATQHQRQRQGGKPGPRSRSSTPSYAPRWPSTHACWPPPKRCVRERRDAASISCRQRPHDGHAACLRLLLVCAHRCTCGAWCPPGPPPPTRLPRDECLLRNWMPCAQVPVHARIGSPFSLCPVLHALLRERWVRHVAQIGAATAPGRVRHRTCDIGRAAQARLSRGHPVLSSAEAQLLAFQAGRREPGAS